VKDRRAVSMCLMEGSVEVIKEAETGSRQTESDLSDLGESYRTSIAFLAASATRSQR